MSVTTYKPCATAITCREDDEDAMVMLGAYRELERENAALREALERADLALGNLGIGSAAPVRVIARNALRNEAQPCPHCTNGIVRSLGRDNDEVIEDCPHCSREQRKEAQP